MKEKGISKGRVSFFRGAFLGLAWVLAACIVVQTLIAGMALFRDGSMWRSHVMFVHIFEIVPLLMLIAAFAGSMAARYKWSSLALLLLVFAQYVTANVPTAGALHPVLAISMFWLAVETARAAGRGLRRGKETGA